MNHMQNFLCGSDDSSTQALVHVDDQTAVLTKFNWYYSTVHPHTFKQSNNFQQPTSNVFMFDMGSNKTTFMLILQRGKHWATTTFSFRYH